MKLIGLHNHSRIARSSLTFDSVRLGDYFEGIFSFVYDDAGDADETWVFTLAD
jgi:hypothetical protein